MKILAYFSKYNKYFLVIYFLISIILFIFSYINIHRDANSFLYQLPNFIQILSGMFVFGDALIFGFFLTIACIVLFYINDYRYTLLTFLTYAAVRSAGEVIYWFLWQFGDAKGQTVGNPFSFINESLSLPNVFILYQIFQQSVLVISIIFLFLLNKYWKEMKHPSAI